jgi:hypothetical protein
MKMVKISKTIAEERLADVPQEKRFWCSDGRVLRSLPELGVALKQMQAGAFRHHSRESSNDFSNWVREVIGDEKLSRDLLKSTTQAQAAKSVDNRVSWLKSKIEV